MMISTDEKSPSLPAVRRQGAGEAHFGKLLLSHSTLSLHSLSVAIDHAEQQQVPLADAIVTLGFATEDETYTALAEATGMTLIDLSATPPGPLALRLVPERVARRHVLMPISEDNRSLTYAISRPFDNEAERDVGFASGRKPVAMLARRSELLSALDRWYPKMGEIDLLLGRVRSGFEIQLIEGADALAQTGSPIIDLCNHIVARAVDVGASDVHLEPTPQGLSVRYRLCGILEPIFTIPPEAANAVCNRYKVMAHADISVKHRPQDGSFRLRISDRPIDVRLSTLPTITGEKVVMRVIDSHATPQDLDSLGYDAANLDRLRKALSRPDGLILVTGPTGSGKTTALYSALSHLQNGHTNIVSVEDPVERHVAGVNQILVNPRAGNTFSTVLRSILRQDPNVIMVGEIRDNEVAQIVGQAAYTGHLVLSSLHTADAASAVTRLLNLGLEPHKVSESLTAIVAQRLLRKLCPDCRETHDDAEATRLGLLHGVARVPASAGAGCDRCRHTGYTDRMPVVEVLVPDDAVRDAIGRGATAGEIRGAMRAAGCVLMRDRALELVVQGLTSIDEVNRVLAADLVAATAKSAKRRVLIADDDRITRMLVKLLLERDGYEVLEGENGAQAVEIARRERPDLLIIDLMMPEMDGYEAIEKLRRDVSLATLPVMVLTSEDGPGIELRVLKMGADDYMIKPFEPEILLSRVQAAFRRQERAVAA
jgi:type IV pilus assembly protein PilB